MYSSTCHILLRGWPLVDENRTGFNLSGSFKEDCVGLSEASAADGELLIVCSDILRHWCVTLGFKFCPNAQPMHNLWHSHQR